MTTNEGPLAGLRVIEVSGEMGRFAGKILAESGASVARIGHASSGPAMATVDGGLLDWWLEGGKQFVDVDLDSEAGSAAYRRLAASADLVIDTTAPGRLAALGLDHADLLGANQRLVQVSLTPFGRTGPRAEWQTSDLVAGAMSGILSLSGTAEHPISAWGRQNLTFGSLMACICGLAGVHAARETGQGALVDLSLHEVLTGSVENLFFQWWFPDLLPIPQRALRQGSLHWLGAYVVADCKTGACNIAPVPQPTPLFEWMAEEGDPEGDELSKLSIEEALADIPRVMNAIRRFARTKDSGELFHEAQRRHIAFGEVQTIAQVATNPQYEFRGTFRSVDGADGVRMPGPFARFNGTPSPAAAAAAGDGRRRGRVARLVGCESTRRRRRLPSAHHAGPTSAGKPLAGLRIVDFTWVLAGPHSTRILGDLGADVLKFQSSERATLVNLPEFPYFYVWNRSKRLVSLDMKRPEALTHIRRIIEQSDVLMENFSAGVLDRWGIGYEQVKEWNPEIVYVTMSGPGHEGPWSKVITYAPTIHALCGLTYLSNPADRRDVGPGFSLNDHAAGLCATVAVLSAIEARRRTGEGQHIDIAQMETGTYLIGPAVLDFLANGREAHPIGNADPFGQWCPNEVYRSGDQHEVAITCRDDDDWRRLCEVVSWDVADLAADPSLATAAGRFARSAEIDERLRRWCTTRPADVAVAALQNNGVPAGKVQDGGDLMADPQLVARDFWRSFDHPVFGTRPFDRFPGLWSTTDLLPYVPSGSFVGESNFDVYRDIAGMTEDEIGIGVGDGLFN